MNRVTRVRYERSVPIVTLENDQFTERSLIDILILSIFLPNRPYVTLRSPFVPFCFASLSCSFEIIVLPIIN